ncbi:TPM domain-containing protein [Agrilutibacter solisilvae]|uniref:TPM domain-containing protein n=1 Tax=Agrilutibacter solisilvae TaxID=2763317 RepID=A0A974Y118_9GAMM|nr:TPM domain-containing protein [Lysobacter solisilvae]QSX78465.1 TPM domain-containing protein [Lysobacter solisilvae]
MRLLRHLFAPGTRRLFAADALERIAQAIHAAESRHTGEVRFAVESALHPRAVLAGVTARARAQDVFAQLRVWDTRANNGVLLYLLLADHRIEIVADRGFQGLVSPEQWRGACQLVEERLRAGEALEAVLQGVAALSALVEAHFPRDADYVDENELPDEPHVF